MKTILITIFAVLISLICFAQNGINYKALIKDANGNALVSQGVFVQFQILESGTLNVYQETHNTVTDANGIVVVNIGEGTVDSGNFLTVDWGSADHFLNVQVDSGDGFVDLGTTQFKSVPYAIMAETVKTSPISDFALVRARGGGGSGKVRFFTETYDLTNNFEPDPNATGDPLLSRFIATEAGYYSINADSRADFIDDDQDFVHSISIKKNGINSKSQDFTSRTAGPNNINTIYIHSIEYLLPGDYIEIFVSVFRGFGSVANLEVERIR